MYVSGLEQQDSTKLNLATDTGISKTVLNRTDWLKVKPQCKFVKTSKRFRPYGTSYHLPIKGKSEVVLKSENGASITTWVYVNDDPKEQSLLGERDARRLGIVYLDPKGASEEVELFDGIKAESVNRISYGRKSKEPNGVVSGGETQAVIDKRMQEIIEKFPTVFTDRTGKCKGAPIEIQTKARAIPVIQPPRRIPLQYLDKVKDEIQTMLAEDIIEGPILKEEPGTFLSNLVITDKKGSDRIRVTLDCQDVNKEIYATHEPIPTTEELRHQLSGSDRFSTLDMTNCYHQFVIEERARKLFSFRTPWGIFRYKRMVMGTSPASSEIQKKIREIINKCENAIHIKDDILVHGVGKHHDVCLEKVLLTLKENDITLRPTKCHLGQREVKWFGNIYSKDGMSPDPEKCAIIKNWPAPVSCKEVKSFLQTVQFNAKFLGAEKPGEKTYPELTGPLRALTKKNARFVWGDKEQCSFQQIKDRLCSDRVLAAYDTERPTRLYCDSSPIGTQSLVAQSHILETGEEAWRPVNHMSRPWTPAEAGYGQIERESNGIYTGMLMNKMYTLGTHVEVVTDHEPLIPIYGSSQKPTQIRVNSHRTKLLPFDYSVVYEPGETTPCDYGSRHPPKINFSQKEIEEWGIDEGTDIHVNRLLEESFPKAISLESVRAATQKDTNLSKLIGCLKTRDKRSCKKNLANYHGVFDELSEMNGLVVRGHQIVIPAAMQANMIAISHEGHQASDKTLKLLRETCWFPRMSKAVAEFVESCLSCNASTSHSHPVPLEPNLLPARPWQKVHADFKGPIGGDFYLHVVIDQYSKYPEVDLIKSTSFKKLKPILDRIFATHGIPEEVTSDNGPPYDSNALELYAEEMGIKLTPVSPNDPQCNGFAENFVKGLCKMVHTSIIERKDPKSELYTYLLHYRAIPHGTTGVSPAKMLFNRKLRTKLPQIHVEKESDTRKKIREDHDKNKMSQKKYFDKRHRATKKEIKIGDKALIKQIKSTTKPPYDPHPFVVHGIDGNKITMSREDGAIRVRDKNQVKILKDRPESLIPSWESSEPICADYNSFDIESEFDNNLPSSSVEENNSFSNSTSENEEMEEVYSEGAVEDSENDSTLFDLSSEAESRMRELLMAASSQSDNHVENDKRVTRSSGMKLTWNPSMGDKDVLLHDDSNEN